MLKLFSISLDIDTEYSVVGVADVPAGTVEFHGQLNGETFAIGDVYEEVRETVMQRIQNIKPHNLEILQ